MSAPRIAVALTAPRDGFLIATMPQTDVFTYSMPLVVGDVWRASRDGEPEKWRAYLWPCAGGVLHVTKSVEAVDAASPEKLRAALQKRTEKDGQWWDVAPAVVAVSPGAAGAKR